MPRGEFQFNLSPKSGMIAGGVILVLIIAAIIAKPSLLAEQVNGIDEIESERIVPEIDLQLKSMLEAELVQRRPRRIGDITIDAVRAEPRRRYLSRHDFWHSEEIRYVDLHITFTVDGETMHAEADVTVSGIADQVALNSVELVRLQE